MSAARVAAALGVGLVFLASLAGCVKDTFPPGLACNGPGDRCPPNQQCFPTTPGRFVCDFQPPPPPGDAHSGSDGMMSHVDAHTIDAGPVDAAPSCKPVGVDLCGSGKGCYPNLAGSGFVCDTAGPVAPGSACNVDRNCTAGHACTTTVFGKLCLQYCDSTVPMCTQTAGPPGTCVQFGGTSGVGTCQTCNPLDQTGMLCPPGQKCYLDPMHMSANCHLPGTLGVGAACTSAPECQPGLHCFPCGGGMAKCTPICDSNTQCGGFICQPMAGATLGACTCN